MRMSAGIFSISCSFDSGRLWKRKQMPRPDPVPVKAETVATQEVRPAWRYSGEIRPDTRGSTGIQGTGLRRCSASSAGRRRTVA